MTTDDEGQRGIGAALAAYWSDDHPTFTTNGERMQAAIRAYLTALPGWRLVPIETEKGGHGTRVLSVVIRDGEKWPPPPGLSEDSET